MVRLRGQIGTGYSTGTIFQFLNGTIKRTTMTFSAMDYLTFQFLNGTIKRMGKNGGGTGAKAISIPKWYD